MLFWALFVSYFQFCCLFTLSTGILFFFCYILREKKGIFCGLVCMQCTRIFLSLLLKLPSLLCCVFSIVELITRILIGSVVCLTWKNINLNSDGLSLWHLFFFFFGKLVQNFFRFIVRNLSVLGSYFFSCSNTPNDSELRSIYGLHLLRACVTCFNFDIASPVIHFF